jgi:hypothetical protein
MPHPAFASLLAQQKPGAGAAALAELAKREEEASKRLLMAETNGGE